MKEIISNWSLTFKLTLEKGDGRKEGNTEQLLWRWGKTFALEVRGKTMEQEKCASGEEVLLIRKYSQSGGFVLM